jgi:membrane protease YdiL (CAAX protease family)
MGAAVATPDLGRAPEIEDNTVMKPANAVLPRIRNRIRKLGSCDRLLLLLTVAWTILGIPGNYLRVHGPMDGARQFGTLPWMIQILWMVLLAAIVGVIAYSVILRQRRPADYGFSFNRGGVASLAILAVIHVYLAISGKFVLSATGSFFLLTVFGSFMEELAFRVIAIDKLILLMDGIKAKAFWAILASSVLWCVPHVVSKPPSQLVGGIFFGGLLFGYIYYKSKSILLPAWIHVVANAGYAGGVLIAALYCLIGIVDSTVGLRNKHTSRSAVA